MAPKRAATHIFNYMMAHKHSNDSLSPTNLTSTNLTSMPNNSTCDFFNPRQTNQTLILLFAIIWILTLIIAVARIAQMVQITTRNGQVLGNGREVGEEDGLVLGYEWNVWRGFVVEVYWVGRRDESEGEDEVDSEDEGEDEKLGEEKPLLGYRA